MAAKYKKPHSSLHPHRGWHPDHLDPRDIYAAPPTRSQVAKLPAKVSLRQTPHYPAPYNQKEEGACTSFSTHFLLHYREIVMTGGDRPLPAFNFGYYNTRSLMGTVMQDSGGTNRLALKSAAKWGYCADKLWPYDQGSMFTKPSAAAYRAAARHELKSFMYVKLVQDQAHMKAVLAQGLPFNIGFLVYQSFMNTGKDGIIALPNYQTEKLLGGHSVAITGYDDSKRAWEMRNSWDTTWADNGHAWLPYSYTDVDAKLASDPWTVQNVPTPDEES